MLAAGSKIKTVGACVPLNIYVLAIEQARKERITLSQMVARLIVQYLREKGTRLKA